MAERRGLEPLRRCRRPELSKPVPYLSGNTPQSTSPWYASLRGVARSIPVLRTRKPLCGGSKIGTGCGHRHLKTPRRVLFGPHSAAMDAAAYRRWAMELAPMAGFEPAHLVGTYCPPALPLSYIGIKQGPWFGPPAVNNEVTNPGPPGPPYLAGTDARIPWTHAM